MGLPLLPVTAVNVNDPVGAAPPVLHRPWRPPGSPAPAHPPEGTEEATGRCEHEHEQDEGPGLLGTASQHHLKERRGQGASDDAEDAASDDGGHDAAGWRLLRWPPTRRGWLPTRWRWSLGRLLPPFR
jgi:hypothetical protein